VVIHGAEFATPAALTDPDAVAKIRDATAAEVAALEALQRRSSDVWEEYREALAANPDAIELPQTFIDKGWVRVVSMRRLGAVVDEVSRQQGEWEEEQAEDEGADETVLLRWATRAGQNASAIQIARKAMPMRVPTGPALTGMRPCGHGARGAR
jgi:hypothetical protein